MRTKDLDVLKPEGYEITFDGKPWNLEALSTEQVIAIWPKLKQFREAAATIAEIREGKDAAELLGDETFVNMLKVAQEIAEIAIPEFPADKMTPEQLTAFMDALSGILGTVGKGEAIPKETEA
jgi:hypothetical protein